MLYQLSYWPIVGNGTKLLELHLLMDGMGFTPLAVLLECKFFRRILFVFRGVIVAAGALFTTEMNRFSHRFSSLAAGSPRRVGCITR